MSLTFTIDHDRNLAEVRGSGKVTLDDTIHVVRAVAADIAHVQCGCLVDIRELDFFPTIAELKEIAFEFIRLRAAFRCGTSFIVGNDKHYALGRFLAMLVDTAGIRMAVFKDPGAAEYWLLTHTGAHRAMGRVGELASKGVGGMGNSPTPQLASSPSTASPSASAPIASSTPTAPERTRSTPPPS